MKLYSSPTPTCAIEQGHGRIEAREYHVMPADELATNFPAWTGLKSIGVTMVTVHRQGLVNKWRL